MIDSYHGHLEPESIAAYVDGGATGKARAAVEGHLAGCADCRAEMFEVSRILRTLPRRRTIPVRYGIPAAAAALILLWVALPMGDSPAPEHRQEPVLPAAIPEPVSPLGAVDSAPAFLWTSVPYATSYRLRLFGGDGTVLWTHESADTLAVLPDSVRLGARLVYFWRVEAQTGFERWASSDLAEFTPRRGRQR